MYMHIPVWIEFLGYYNYNKISSSMRMSKTSTDKSSQLLPTIIVLILVPQIVVSNNLKQFTKKT